MKLVSSELKYNGRIIKVYLDSLDIDSQIVYREIIRHNGGACVLAERDGKFAFVKQYRHPFGRDFLEIPAGTKDAGERPEVTAIRELEEECGLVAKNIIFVCDFAVSPGYTDESISIYYCNKFENGNQKLDEDEKLSVLWLEKEVVFNMLTSGQIKDGKTVMALYWYMLKFGNK